ncbi:hypothetical protein [Cupriavidus basilensis]
MSAQGLPWFRMYTDFLNDPKLISLAFEDQRHFIGVLALKCAGAIDEDCDPDLLDRIVAQRLWIDHSVIREVKKRLVAAGLIGSDWQPANWEKRQFRSDRDPTAAERQRRHREKNSRNALRNEDVTPTDTDTDSDSEEDRHKKPPRRRDVNPSSALTAKDLIAEGVDKQVAVDWLTLRKAKRLPLTPTTWADVTTEAEKAGMTPAQAVEAAVHAGWVRFKAEWIQHDGPRKQGGGAWWLSPETKLAKAIEVGAGPAWPGETDAAWAARIRAAIDNGCEPLAPGRLPQAVTIRDPGAAQEAKPVISEANRAAALAAAGLVRKTPGSSAPAGLDRGEGRHHA